MVNTKSGILLYQTKEGRHFSWHIKFPDNKKFTEENHLYLDTGQLCNFLYMIAVKKIPKEKAWLKISNKI